MLQNPAAPLAPMTPDAAVSAFDRLRAVQAGDAEAAAEFADAEPRMPALLVDVAERIVVPITALAVSTLIRAATPSSRRMSDAFSSPSSSPGTT
ncbi:hypothetical protein ACWCQB_23730 [Streptomyces hirsutus]|uniref:hypothetical protein n=1 Tax=Streptomyces hirsutus TaxID=35620 RepID=UPI00331A4818